MKLSEANKGKPGRVGQVNSKEVLKRHAEFMKGNAYSLGAKRSEETKRKLAEIGRERMKGNKFLLGHKHTDESKAKMSSSRIGKVTSEKTKEKLSAAMKAHSARKKNLPQGESSGQHQTLNKPGPSGT